MKKINISKRKALIIGSVALVIAFVGVTVYELQELKGLRARVHSLEYAKGEEARIAEEENQAYEEQKINYEVISKETADLRVEKEVVSMDASDQIEYETKKVLVYKLKVTNNTSDAYDYTEGDVKGKTKAGSLVAPISGYTVHPDDQKGKDTVSLAPGGSAEVYVYILADEEIVDLYYSSYGYGI
jgi:hypothetical protein